MGIRAALRGRVLRIHADPPPVLDGDVLHRHHLQGPPHPVQRQLRRTGPVHRTVPRSSLPARVGRHRNLRARRPADHHGDRPRVRGGPQQGIQAPQRVLQGGVLRAGRRQCGRSLRRVEVHPPEGRPAQLALGRLRHCRTGLAARHPLRTARADGHDHLAQHGNADDHLPRRPAGHPRGAEGGCGHRRRGQMAHLPQHHASAAQAHAAAGSRAPFRRLPAVLRGILRDDSGRAARLDALRRVLRVPEVRFRTVRNRFRSQLGAVHHHRAGQRAPVPHSQGGSR